MPLARFAGQFFGALTAPKGMRGLLRFIMGRLQRMRWGFFVAGLLLGGCATFPSVHTTPLADQSAVAERPDWNVGDRWVFRWREGFSNGTYSRVVIEESLSGYVVRYDEKDREVHYMADLSYVMQLEGGELRRLFSPPRPYFKWPLARGMKWESGSGVT